MSKPITLFSGYSQRENRVTNYCLLVLKMLYEENPKYLGEVLSGLVGEDISGKIGVDFRQQERKAASTPDGLIIQAPVTVYIETKNFDWFYDTQLEAHLKALAGESPGLNLLLALGNFESSGTTRFGRIQALCRDHYQGKVSFAAASFEDFLTALDVQGLPKNLSDAIADLRDFLDEENLLPSWHRYLDVVNCAGLPDDVIDGGVYMCPATGGAYNHSRCKYFGMYRQKRVERVALIEAVVDVELGVDANLKWSNIERDAKQLTELARKKVEELRPDEGPTRIFLLGPLYETDFQKDSPGGMLASKRYFDISRLQIKTAEQLAEALKGKKWSEFE